MQRLGPRADGRHVAARHDAKLAEGAAYRVSDIGRREMRVVALANAGVGVPELRRDHRERDALHREAARIGVPERMEIDPWDNPCSGARVFQRSELVRPSPWLARR